MKRLPSLPLQLSAFLFPAFLALGCADDDSGGSPGSFQSNPSCGVSQYDLNGDCLLDALGAYVDENGDGAADGLDTNADGFIDLYAIDIDFNGTADGFGIDRNGDTLIDAVDTTGDGQPDYVGASPDDLPQASTWYAPTISAAQLILPEEYTKWFNGRYEDCGNGTASIPKDATSMVSEGMGYGMLITANAGSQAEYNALFQFYISNLNSSGGLMGWQCEICGTCKDNAATDADLDAAMSMLQAESRFGGGTYGATALQIIQTLRNNFVWNCSGRLALVAGEWAGCNELNPSYFAPGYYRVFAQVDVEGAAIWTQMIDDAYVLLDLSKDAHHDANLLWPDGMYDDGTTHVGSFADNGYDACRVPWRIATDYAWSGDPRAKALLEYVGQQVDASGMDYLSTNTNSAFFGALSFGGLAGDQARADALYAQWMDSSLQDSSYYQGTLRMLYLLISGAQFPAPEL